MARATNGITMAGAKAIADAASWYCAFVLVGLFLFASMKEINYIQVPLAESVCSAGRSFTERRRPCDEIYVVNEGETLHTISDKCGDPYIVERNPHIHDPDDVFPGLVIRIIPSPHNIRKG